MSRSPEDQPRGTQSGLPLPAHRYVPGLNARHREGAFDHIRAKAHAQTQSSEAGSNMAWLHGLDLLEHGFFWEAHEVLEQVWMNAHPNTAERAMVQGVIQLANAALKLDMGRARAAQRLCTIAGDHVHQAALAGDARVMGLAPATVQSGIAKVLASIETGAQVRIRLCVVKYEI